MATTNNGSTSTKRIDIRDWFCTPHAEAIIHNPVGPGNYTLARGAFGEVSVGIHSCPNDQWRFLAIKSISLSTGRSNNQWGVSSQSSPASPKLPKEVFNEICALRLLTGHANIVHLVGVYPSSNGSNQICLAFHYCPTDLYTTLEWRRQTLQPPLSFQVLAGIAHDVLEALIHCHSKGVLHLDVKPGNLLVTSRGHVQLCDFGLSQPYALEKGDNEQHEEEPKGLCTLYYRPPELLLGSQAVSPAIDMYSAGLLFCELLVGFPIFRGQNALGQLAAIFDVLGTPTKETWPTVDQLPDYGKLQFAPKTRQSLAHLVPRATESPGWLSLLQNLVVLDPSQRWTAKQALEQRQDWIHVPSRSCMQFELLPSNLQEPLLLSNPSKDLSIASQKCLQLATTKRGFLKGLSSWKKEDPSKQTTTTLLETRCTSLCPKLGV